MTKANVNIQPAPDDASQEEKHYDEPSHQIAPKRRRREKRFEIGIFFRKYKKGRLILNVEVPPREGGEPAGPRARASAAAAEKAKEGAPATGVKPLSGHPQPDPDSGPIDNRVEIGFFVRSVTETSDDG